MDFDSCKIDFSDLDGGCFVHHQESELAWPPIFQSSSSSSSIGGSTGGGSGGNCWVKDFVPPNSTFISRANFASYSAFMDACKREDTIEELLKEQSALKEEVLDLHRQNFALETEKEKLINDLIHFGITERFRMDVLTEKESEATQTIEAPPKDDGKDAKIEELEAKLLEAQERCAQLEKEKIAEKEKMFELDMDKQRLNIKLHHYTQITKNLEEVNDDLEDEIKQLKAEKKQLSEKLQKMEQKIERIEEGDFEHVSHEDEVIPTVILI